MKTKHRHLIAVALLAGLGLGAVAQAQTPPPAGPGAPGPRMMQGERGRMDPARMEERMRAHREERMARRLGELRQILQVTPQQEGAWTTWTTAMKPVQLQRPNRAEFARMTTPERIDRIQSLRAQRNTEMDRRLEATKTFYAGLSTEQKRLFDAEGMRFLRGGERGGMGGHFGRHHRG